MSEPSDKQPLLDRLKERKLVQWALAYIAGGWIVLQVLDVTAEPWGLSGGVVRAAQAVIVVGLFITLVLAWYHGDQSRQRVSGPEILIIAGLLVVAGFLSPRFSASDGESADAEIVATSGPDVPIQPSVAVLPFVNMSGNPDNEYFSDGITEELLNALAQIPGLRVPARTSSFAFKGQNLPIQEIASRLSVAHVLEGSVRRDEGTVLITARLSDPRTDSQLWSDSFERELEDLFAIQREIATAIVDQLELALTGGQQATLVAGGTDDPEAHDAYLRGRYLVDQRTQESLSNAVAEFGRAIDLDPDYAEAHSGLADSYVLAAAYGFPPGYRSNVDAGLSAARTAIELDPNLGMAHTSLGFGLWNLGEWNAAEEAFRQAIRLAPQYAPARQWYGLLLLTTGRPEEAIIEAERAVELDPVYRQAYRNLLWPLQAAGRMEDAIQRSREMIELAPDWAIGWQDRALVLFRSGDYDGGLEAGLESERLFGGDVEAAREAYGAIIRYAQTGEPNTTAEPPGLVVRAWFYASVGQPDRAIDLLEQQVAVGDIGNTALSHVLDYSDLLGDDPRYQALLEEAGITW